MSYRLGVDVGGTFTDLLLINEQDGDIFTAKVPSTPHDSSVGVLNGPNTIPSTRPDPVISIGEVWNRKMMRRLASAGWASA